MYICLIFVLHENRGNDPQHSRTMVSFSCIYYTPCFITVKRSFLGKRNYTYSKYVQKKDEWPSGGHLNCSFPKKWFFFPFICTLLPKSRFSRVWLIFKEWSISEQKMVDILKVKVLGLQLLFCTKVCLFLTSKFNSPT